MGLEKVTFALFSVKVKKDKKIEENFEKQTDLSDNTKIIYIIKGVRYHHGK